MITKLVVYWVCYFSSFLPFSMQFLLQIWDLFLQLSAEGWRENSAHDRWLQSVEQKMLLLFPFMLLSKLTLFLKSSKHRCNLIIFMKKAYRKKIYSECLESERSDFGRWLYTKRSDFRQCPNSNKSLFGFQHVRDFWDTQNVRISACSDLRQCLKSERLNVYHYHWLLNSLQQAFWFFDTPTFSLTE